MDHTGFVDWPLIVARDTSKFHAAIDWLQVKLKEGREVCACNGALVDLAKEQANHFATYGAYKNQVDTLADMWSSRLKNIEATVMHEWKLNPPTSQEVKATELKKIIMVDDRYVEIEIEFGLIDYLKKQYDTLMKSLEQRHYQITNLVTLHKNGLEYVSV